MINFFTFFDKKIPKTVKIYTPIILLYLISIYIIIFSIPFHILLSILGILGIFLYFFNKFILSKENLLENKYIDMMEDYRKEKKLLLSEKEKLLQELEKSFNEFDKVVISSKTDLFGVITYVSKAFCDISGYTEDEMLGKSHNIVRHPDTPKETFKEMWKTIENNKIWSGDIKNLKKDGGFYWVRSVVSPIYDEYGVKIGYNSIRHDITKDKEEKLNKII